MEQVGARPQHGVELPVCCDHSRGGEHRLCDPLGHALVGDAELVHEGFAEELDLGQRELVEQELLGAEVVEERGVANAHARSDVSHARLLVATLPKQLERRLQEVPALALLLLLAQTHLLAS